MTYSGSCHCGKVAYTVEAEMQEAVECNCSICSRRGYLLLPRLRRRALRHGQGRQGQ
jgi:hypothetical protein